MPLRDVIPTRRFRITATASDTTTLQVGLLLAGATLLTLLHTAVMSLLGWPAVPAGIAPGISVVHGFLWGLSGLALLLVGGILVGPLGGRTLAQNMRLGAHFLYGAFIAHALFDARFGGDWVDPLLYSGSAALVVRFSVLVFELTLRE